MNYPKRDLKASLIDKHYRFKELTDKLTHQLENLSRSIDGLEEYKEKLEKTKHEKVVRKKMRDMAIQTNKMIMHISNIFKELKDIRFGDPKDRENRTKTLKRLRGYFTRQHDRFVQSLSSFQDKEKLFIEQRMSLLLGPDTTSILSSPNHFESITDPGIEVARQDMDFYHSLLQERETHVKQFRGIAYEIKLMAVDQAKAVNENQRDLENAVSEMSGAEQMVNDGHDTLEEHERHHKKKRFDAGCKRNVAVCLLVVIVCGIVLISTLATGVLKLD